jgi:hypothetical protein
MRRVCLIVFLVFGTAAGGAAADGGPSPGVLTGFGGVAGPGGQLRYVAVSAGNSTVVQAIRTRDGRVLRYRALRGYYGIPVVAYDGTAGGLSHDAKTLVLSTYPQFPNPRAVSRFAVLDAANFRLRRTVTLRGTFAYDALAPDASTLYLIQYTSAQNVNRYRVRAYDLKNGKLLSGAIVDKSEPKEPMTGQPLRRVTTPDGDWVYTLYSRVGDKPFIHALNAANKFAVCLDLDAWRGSQNILPRYRLSLSAGRLVLSTPDGTRVLSVAAPAY